MTAPGSNLSAGFLNAQAIMTSGWKVMVTSQLILKQRSLLPTEYWLRITALEWQRSPDDQGRPSPTTEMILQKIPLYRLSIRQEFINTVISADVPSDQHLGQNSRMSHSFPAFFSFSISKNLEIEITANEITSLKPSTSLPG